MMRTTNYFILCALTLSVSACASAGNNDTTVLGETRAPDQGPTDPGDDSADPANPADPIDPTDPVDPEEPPQEFRSDLLQAALPSDSRNLGPLRVPLPDTQVYQSLGGRTDVVTISIVEGIGHSLGNDSTNRNNVGPSLSRLYIYGLRNAENDAVVLTDTWASVVDLDGSSGLFGIRDARYSTTVADLPPGRVFTGTANSATGSVYHQYFFWRAEDETGFLTNGKIIMGVSTDPQDMPTSGNAIYQGNAKITRHDGNRLSLFDGTSRVIADFEQQRVDVEITPGYTLIDEINVDGMQIDGNKFTGGTVEILFEGDDVTESITGGVTGTDAAGIFYGPSRGAPVEVGGVINVGGNDASFNTLFSAN